MVDHLVLSLDWPVGIEWALPGIVPARVRGHTEMYPNQLVIHGLWGVDAWNNPVVFCNTFDANRQTMNTLKTTIEGIDQIDRYWPSFSDRTNFEFWASQWVSGSFCFFNLSNHLNQAWIIKVC